METELYSQHEWIDQCHWKSLIMVSDDTDRQAYETPEMSLEGELPTVSNGDDALGCTALGALTLDLVNHVHAFQDLAKHHVLAIQPAKKDEGQKKRQLRLHEATCQKILARAILQRELRACPPA